MSLNLGDIIDGKYKIVRLIGEGGMGVVYEGENLRIHRRVAIKILHANVAQSKDAVQRFEREAQAAGRIGSDHIVEVLDLGELPGGDRYMVMEFLEGQSLAERIQKQGALSPQKCATIMVGMLEGLRAAHDAGIVHRDLKPDNVFLLTHRSGQPDFVKILDFGISKFSTLGGEFSMTQTGAVMGTPYYLSPEQAKGERNVDALSDLYAAGVILWESVAGKVPFDGETFNELLFKIVLEPVPDLGVLQPNLDPHFVSLVQKAMARDRQLRFQSATDMQTALVQWLEGQPLSSDLAADAQAARITRPHLPSSVDLALGNTATVQTTAGNWANTSRAQPATPASKKWLLAAGVAMLLAAGAGMLLRSAAVDKERAQAQAEQQRAERSAEERTRLEVERTRAETARTQTERNRLEAEKQEADAQLSAAERAGREAQDKKEAAAAPAPRPAATVLPRPTPRPRPATTPAPRPATAAPTSAGRTIRTDL